ncbi:MAG: ABC transporter substrate-binding protein [Thermomicrobiales bacterium]
MDTLSTDRLAAARGAAVSRRAVLRGLAGCGLAATFLLPAGIHSPRFARAAGDEFKIAVVGPMSGDGAVFGEQFARGAEMAARKINDAGGVDGRTIAILPFDDRNDLTESVNVAQKIASDGDIVASMGHFTSSAVLAVMPVYEANQLPLVVISGSDPKITEQGNPWIYRVSPANDGWARQMADLIVTRLDLPTVASFYINTDYGISDHQSFVEQSEANGGDIVFEESYQPDTTDFTSALIKLKSAAPDAVYLSSYHNDAALIITQAKAAGIETRWFTATPVLAGPFPALGGEAVEGTIIASLPEGNRWVAVAKEYGAAYGEAPSPLVIFAYTATQAIAEAARGGAVSRDGIRGGLEHLEALDTALGPLTFDEQRQASYAAYEYVIVQEGTFQPWQP